MTQDNARSEDPTALNARSRLNNECGSFDLAAWVRKQARLEPGARLLDVGAGTGQLLLRYAGAVLRAGSCVAVDVSAASLRELQAALPASGYSNVETACFDMDLLAESQWRPELRNFTDILSAYALYYSADANRLLAGLSGRLHPDGCLIVVAPAPGNNVEWFALLERAGVRVPAKVHAVSTFLDDTVLPFARRHFAAVTAEFETNTVRLDSVDEIDAYWRSNIYFEPSKSEALHACARDLCREQGGLVNRKRIGLVTMRGRLAP